MNSHRDNVKDALAGKLGELGIELDDLPAEIADAVFDALGITETEQDAEGGYWMHIAGKRSKDYILIPLTDEIKNSDSWEEAGHYIWKFITGARSDGN